MRLRHAQRLMAGIGASLVFVTTFSGTAHANPDAPYIGYGYANIPPAVRCAQQFANRYGNYRTAILVDGRYGPETNWGIKQFQAQMLRSGQYSLTVDGVVGKATGRAMLGMAWRDHDLEPGIYGDCLHYLPS